MTVVPTGADAVRSATVVSEEVRGRNLRGEEHQNGRDCDQREGAVTGHTPGGLPPRGEPMVLSPDMVACLGDFPDLSGWDLRPGETGLRPDGHQPARPAASRAAWDGCLTDYCGLVYSGQLRDKFENRCLTGYCSVIYSG